MNNIKFMYLKHCPGTKEERVLTIARKYNKITNVVNFAYSLCCANDHHNRKIGRQIAINRLERPDLSMSAYCGNKRAIDVTMEEIAKLDFNERPGFISAARIVREELKKEGKLLDLC